MPALQAEAVYDNGGRGDKGRGDKMQKV